MPGPMYSLSPQFLEFFLLDEVRDPEDVHDLRHHSFVDFLQVLDGLLPCAVPGLCQVGLQFGAFDSQHAAVTASMHETNAVPRML